MPEETIILRDYVGRHGNRWCLAILILTLAFSTSVRIRLADMPLERDEGEYAYAGQLMLEGIPPYKLAYNMKLPGTYAAYAAIMPIFGQTSRGIHLGLLVVNAITILLTYFLGRRLFGAICGLVAATAFMLSSLSYAFLGLAAHATHFVTLFAMAGALVFWNALNRPRPSRLFFSGLLFGLAFLMKQQGVFFIVFGGMILLWDRWRTRSRPSQGARQLAWYSGGVCLPLAFTATTLVWSGVWSRFWFWNVSYARQYALLTTWPEAWKNFQSCLARPTVTIPALVMLAAIGGLLVLFQRKETEKRVFLIALGVTALATTVPGFYFREHYFIPALPILGIFAGAGFQIASDELRSRQPNRSLLLCIPALIFLIAVADTIVRNRSYFFHLAPNQASRAIYGVNPFPEAAEIARYIRDHSEPGSKIAILGSEPEIYFYSHRHSATGYIYTYALMEPQPYAPTMQRDMIAEITANNPDYLILVNVRQSWATRENSDLSIFRWLKEWGPRHLQLIGLVNIPSRGAATFLWDSELTNTASVADSNIRIFRRRQFP